MGANQLFGRSAVLAIAGLGGVSVPSFGVNIEYDGPTTDNKWSTAMNWAGDLKPATADQARINTGTTVIIDSTETVTHVRLGSIAADSDGLGGSLDIQAGTDLTVDTAATTTGGEFNIGFAADVTASATMSGGTVLIRNGTNSGGTNGGDFNLADGAAGITASFTQTGGSLTAQDAYILGAGTAATNASATVLHSGGSATVGRGMFIGGGAGTGTYTLSGNATLTINGLGTGQNGLVLANQSNTAGTLIVQGSSQLTVAGQVSLGSTATAAATGNSGTLRVRGNDATIDIGQQFITTGGGTSTLGFDIDDATVSLIDVAGNADLDQAIIDLDSLSGFVPSGQTYDLLTAADILNDGTLSLLTDGDGFDGYQLRVVSGGNGEILQAFVPEPGSLALAAIGAVGLLVRRRRA